MSERSVGFCAVCESSFRVRKDALVHHGYTRPGIGFIVGDCMGVGLRPYELGTDGPEAYKTKLQAALKSVAERLTLVKQDAVDTYEVIERVRTGWGASENKVRAIRRGDEDFKRARESELAQLPRRVADLKIESARMDGWIKKWELRPLRSFDEETQKKAVEVGEKKASRAAAAEEKARESAERDAKEKAAREAMVASAAVLRVEVERLGAMQRAGVAIPTTDLKALAKAIRKGKAPLYMINGRDENTLARIGLIEDGVFGRLLF